ncbi:PREDICTED: protein shisa-5 [Phaethon lepturus]|uniref:protein shisa-5 n=1 Tax=Phaethon lepturus TaxID=97097 RepID=UPI000530B083|nr:PREDICTED: protein shisa-5 [Phaethon lepturus]
MGGALKWCLHVQVGKRKTLCKGANNRDEAHVRLLRFAAVLQSSVCLPGSVSNGIPVTSGGCSSSCFLFHIFGTLIAIGVTVCAVIVITIILCLTCSCCCLYKACRRPRPVVTTTASTTVVHAPYPQQQGVPPNYPVAPYQGYQPVAIQPQPGMPVAPYPAQYPPPYPMQPSGPPAYHETVAAGAGAPYPISQPPYNPAYVDPQKPTY